jgi:hypothetical protein
MPISVARAKAICNASELALVKASAKREIAKLSPAKLRLSAERARKLRDKWRDQANAQRRKSQKKMGARETDVNARTAEKAQLFEEVLERFVARLATAETADSAAKPRAGAKRFARSRSHRAARATVRGSLREAKRELAPSLKMKLTRAKTEESDQASVKALPMEDVSAGGAKSAKPVASRPKSRTSRKPAGADVSAFEAGRAFQGLRVTKQRQLLARTSAKQSRLKAAGLVRIQKNRSAANKRSQAKRDSR